MTETMATVTGNSGEDYLNRPDSCGPPVAVADLKIVGTMAANWHPAKSASCGRAVQWW